MIRWLAGFFLPALLVTVCWAGDGSWLPSPALLMRVETEEGFRPTPYQDTLGNWTQGYGHELQHDTGEEWTRDYARGVLIADLMNAHGLARHIVGETFDSLSPVRQDVLVDMGFQLGGRLASFSDMLSAIRRGDWHAAASAMKASVWRRETPARVDALAMMMETGP